MNIDGKSILITGGTGSFGNAFVSRLLSKHKPARVIIYSRDEMKQWQMQLKFNNDDRLRFFIGDIRDCDRIKMATRGVDYVVHAAAMKIVPIAEYNPFECVKTNVIGAMNLIEACIENGVKNIVALSTDKASSPSNLYGATKLTSDKLFIAGNAYRGHGGPVFSVVRYGNVMGSRGSVIPFFLNLNKDIDTPITNSEMTRFLIDLDQGIDLVETAIDNSLGGEIFVRKIPSVRIVDLAKLLRPNNQIKIVGMRPGEKLHEQMISIEDAPFTYEYADYYKIIPAIVNDRCKIKAFVSGGKKVSESFTYDSLKNKDWVNLVDLKKWISQKKQDFEKL